MIKNCKKTTLVELQTTSTTQEKRNEKTTDYLIKSTKTISYFEGTSSYSRLPPRVRTTESSKIITEIPL